MKNQELKEDLNLLGIMRLDIKGCRSYDVDKLWNWINQNYISKEDILNLECLKEEFVKERWLSGSEEIPKEVFRNQLREEIIGEIKKL